MAPKGYHCTSVIILVQAVGLRESSVYSADNISHVFVGKRQTWTTCGLLEKTEEARFSSSRSAVRRGRENLPCLPTLRERRSKETGCSLGYTVHCTLYTAHCTLYTAHCIVHCTVHCALCTVHFTTRTTSQTCDAWQSRGIDKHTKPSNL